MEWIKIERDKDGFATEECLRKIEDYYEREIPVAVVFKGYEIDYFVITTASNIHGWLADIHNSAKYTHYLPIPKLEL